MSGMVAPGGDGFAAGEGASYDVTGSQTYVGSSKNVFTYQLNESTKAVNYDIVCMEGDLTIVPVSSPITITADSNTKKYDGTALTDSGYTYTEEILVSGDTLTATVEGAQTDAGSSVNTVTGYQVMRGTTDVTSDYTFAESVPGTLEITKRSVTLTSASQSREYDGTALTNSTVTPGGDGFAAGEGASYDVTGRRLDFGTGKNSFTYELNANTKAINYSITKAEGDLTISAISRKITITAGSSNKTYDGTALTDSQFTYTDGILIQGDVLTASVTGNQTDAGESANKITGFTVKRGDTDITANYTFEASIDGTLSVAQADGRITITGSPDKMYDKKSVSSPEVSQTGDGAVSFEYYAIVNGVDQKLSAAPADAGSYRVKAVAADSRNYIGAESTIVDFTITPRSVTITAADAQSAYLSEVAQVSAAVTSDNKVCEGDDLQIHAAASVTSATPTGTYPITPVYADDPNYTVTAVNGTYTVADAQMPYSVSSYLADYDGSSHGITVTGPSGMTVYYSETPLTAANCSSEGKASLTYTTAGNYTVYYCITAPNYIPVTGSSEVNIQRIAQHITSQDITAGYDGSSHSITAETDGGGEITYDNNGRTQAGTSTVTIHASASDNYLAEDSAATITITRRSITVAAGSASKPYDGQALVSGEYSVISGSLAGSDTIVDVKTSGSVTEVGKAANTIAGITIKNASGQDVTDNYEITTVDGTLEITPSSDNSKIKITGIPDEKVNGQKSFDFGAGKIIVTVESYDKDGNQIEGTFVDSENVIEACLTSDEIAAARNGESIEIRLIVTLEPSDLNEDDMQNQDVISQELAGPDNKDQLKLGMFIRLNLEKRIGSAQWQQLKELGEDIDVTIDIPASLQMDHAVYYIARSHNGDYTLLSDLDSEAATITFKTKLFSSYAILYESTEKGVFVVFNLVSMILGVLLTAACFLKKKKYRIPAGIAGVTSIVLYILLFESGVPVLFNVWSILFAAILAAEAFFYFVKQSDIEKKETAEE